MATGTPESTKLEGLLSPESPEKDVPKLRNDYKKLFEAAKNVAMARKGAKETSATTSGSGDDSKYSQLSSKDVDLLSKWLDTPDAQNAEYLNSCMANFEAYKKYVGDQVREYKKDLEKLAKEDKTFSEKSIPSYLKWFHEELDSQERAAYLKNKTTDAHDPARKRVVKEASDLFKYFENSNSKQTVESQKKKFSDKDLQGRQAEVADMKKKKNLLESVQLPSVVVEELKGAVLNAANADAAGKIISANLARHTALKDRFLKLPPPVQMENKENFKKMNLDARGKFLAGFEQKIAGYVGEYRRQIEERQEPDKSGLTLFSNVKESVPDSSADKYMKWFQKDLTLNGMRAAIEQSDLKNPERKTLRDKMREQLIKIPGNLRPAAIDEFNAADFEKRRDVIVKEWEEKCKKLAESPSGGNIVHRILRRIMGSAANTDIEKETKTWAVLRQVAIERQRYTLGLGHNARTNIEGEAAERGEDATLQHTQKVIEAVHDKKLKTDEGDLRLKADTLEGTPEAVTELRRALKPTVGDHNVKIAANVQLVDESSNVIIDTRDYMRGALARKRASIEKKVSPRIQQEARAEGLNLDDKQVQEDLQTANWDEIADENIRKAA